MLVIGVQWNVMLCYFNLLPIPPLDGSKVAAFFLPGPLREKMWAAQAFGVLPLLLIFLVPGVARVLLAPASQLVQALTGFALS